MSRDRNLGENLDCNRVGRPSGIVTGIIFERKNRGGLVTNIRSN